MDLTQLEQKEAPAAATSSKTVVEQHAEVLRLTYVIRECRGGTG